MGQCTGAKEVESGFNYCQLDRDHIGSHLYYDKVEDGLVAAIHILEHIPNHPVDDLFPARVAMRLRGSLKEYLSSKEV